ncbi:MAG: hypothetical protein HUN05_18170 [Desulfobacter sp.]|nr:MAG: hypothetical protein HUN05_18170 [Desulfobacter sp.]
MIKDIHDIRPPVMVGMDPALVRLGLWIGAGCMAACFLFVLVRYLWKRKKNALAKDLLPHISAYDTALKALDDLAVSRVNDAKAFYFDLGRTIKTYMGKTYGFNGLEMTTQELTKTLRSLKEIPSPLRTQVSLFQDLCDPFRYAPIKPDKEQIKKDLEQGRALIMAVEKAEQEARLSEQEVNH